MPPPDRDDGGISSSHSSRSYSSSDDGSCSSTSGSSTSGSSTSGSSTSGSSTSSSSSSGKHSTTNSIGTALMSSNYDQTHHFVTKFDQRDRKSSGTLSTSAVSSELHHEESGWGIHPNAAHEGDDAVDSDPLRQPEPDSEDAFRHAVSEAMNTFNLAKRSNAAAGRRPSLPEVPRQRRPSTTSSSTGGKAKSRHGSIFRRGREAKDGSNPASFRRSARRQAMTPIAYRSEEVDSDHSSSWLTRKRSESALGNEIKMHRAGSSGSVPSIKHRKSMSLVDHLRILNEEHNIALKRKKDSRIVIDPESKYVKVWSVLLTLLVILSVMDASFRLGFDEARTSWSIALFVIADVVFCIDILMKFRKGFYNQARDKIMDVDIIIHRYLHSWFIVDLIASLPLEYVRMAFPFPAVFSMIPRLLRIGHIVHSFSMMEKDPTASPLLSSMTQLLVTLLLVIHFVACLYWGVSRSEGFGINDFVPPASVVDGDFMTRYLRGMFWSIGLMASFGLSRETVPLTFLECILTVCSMHLGVFLMGFTIQTIASFAREYQEMRRKHFYLQEDLNITMKCLRMGPSVQKNVHEYLNYARHMRLGGESMWAKELPASLKKELWMTEALSQMVQVPVFKCLDFRAAASAASTLVKNEYVPNQQICCIGMPASSLYLVAEGEFLVTSSTGISFKAHKGDYFGDYGMFVLGTYSVQAVSTKYSSAYVLDKHLMEIALVRYPAEKIWLQKQSRMCRRLALVIRSFGRRVMRLRTKCTVKRIGGGSLATNLNTPRTAINAWRNGATGPQVNPKMSAQTPRTQLSAWRRTDEPKLAFQRSAEYFLMEPDTLLHSRWNVITTVAMLLQVLIIPAHVSFMYDVGWMELWPSLVLSYGLDLVFFVDIYMWAHTASIVEGGMDRDPASLRRKYFRSRAVVHLLATLPFDVLWLPSKRALWIRMLRLLRIRELLESLTGSSYFEPARHKKLGMFVRLGSLLLSYLCIAHLVACMYFVLVIPYGFGGQYLPPEEFQDASVLRRYGFSVYFALNHLNLLGAGILPQRNNELIFSSSVIIMGLLSAAFLIGRLADLGQTSRSNVGWILTVKKRMAAYSGSHGLKDDLMMRLQLFQGLQESTTQGVNINMALRELPSSLLLIIKTDLCYPLLRAHCMFANSPATLLYRMCKRSKLLFLPQGEVLFRRRSDSTFFGLILGGKMACYASAKDVKDNRPFTTCTRGDLVGEMSALSGSHEVTAIALNHSSIALIDINDFLDNLQLHPNMCAAVSSYIYQRIMRMHDFVKSKKTQNELDRKHAKRARMSLIFKKDMMARSSFTTEFRNVRKVVQVRESGATDSKLKLLKELKSSIEIPKSARKRMDRSLRLTRDIAEARAKKNQGAAPVTSEDIIKEIEELTHEQEQEQQNMTAIEEHAHHTDTAKEPNSETPEVVLSKPVHKHRHGKNKHRKKAHHHHRIKLPSLPNTTMADGSTDDASSDHGITIARSSFASRRKQSIDDSLETSSVVPTSMQSRLLLDVDAAIDWLRDDSSSVSSAQGSLQKSDHE